MKCSIQNISTYENWVEGWNKVSIMSSETAHKTDYVKSWSNYRSHLSSKVLAEFPCFLHLDLNSMLYRLMYLVADNTDCCTGMFAYIPFFLRCTLCCIKIFVLWNVLSKGFGQMDDIHTELIKHYWI